MKKIGIYLLTFILVISQSIIWFAQTECNENQSDKIEMEYISNKFLEYFENNKNSRGIHEWVWWFDRAKWLWSTYY